MGVIGVQRVSKPKTQRAKRALDARAPKIKENVKKSMLIRGGNTSEVINEILKELYLLKKPDSIHFRRKNIMRPFEDTLPLENFSRKCDASLFTFGSHSKKKPNNLVFGRLYNHEILDMIELGISHYVPSKSIEGMKCSLGSKPCLVFAGEDWQSTVEMRRLQNLFTDFFRGPVVPKVRLEGIEHVLQFTAIQGHVLLRTYRICLKKAGGNSPRVELEDMGPHLNLVVKRSRLASDSLYKEALKMPKLLKPKKKKNISHDPFGSKMGRIHMQKQDIEKLQTRKMKGLKKGGKAKKPEEKTETQPTTTE